jgi:hypothetical protein
MPAGSNLVTLILRPVTRLLVGLIAVPLLRTVRRRVFHLKAWDEELERDVELWFRGSLLLLVASKNTEVWLMSRLNEAFALGAAAEFDLNQWYITAGRLLLAIGVIETMPDQDLFSIIHPGPRWNYDRKCGPMANIRSQFRPLCRGLACHHLSRSSPVFAILSVFFGGALGWVFYSLAIVQYLIIGLVTSRDRALDVLAQFDRAIAKRRAAILEEFEIAPSDSPPPPPGDSNT